jgi:hypothetical protein
MLSTQLTKYYLPSQADTDGDGCVSLDEFVVLFKAILEMEDEFLMGPPNPDGKYFRIVPTGVLRRARTKVGSI